MIIIYPYILSIACCCSNERLIFLTGKTVHWSNLKLIKGNQYFGLSGKLWSVRCRMFGKKSVALQGCGTVPASEAFGACRAICPGAMLFQSPGIAFEDTFGSLSIARGTWYYTTHEICHRNNVFIELFVLLVRSYIYLKDWCDLISYILQGTFTSPGAILQIIAKRIQNLNLYQTTQLSVCRVHSYLGVINMVYSSYCGLVKKVLMRVIHSIFRI